MEVRETAACGVAEREFAVDMVEHEIVKFYKVMNAAQEAVGHVAPELIDDLLVQIRQVVGPSVDM